MKIHTQRLILRDIKLSDSARIVKLGFTHEGTRKKAHRSQSTGKLHTVHIYGLLREDWTRYS